MLHHYVPRFYLKYFADNQGKSIGLYNFRANKIVPYAQLYTQCAIDDFYDSAIMEKSLSNIESISSNILSVIMKRNELPIELSADHHALLTFIMFQIMRTPGKQNQIETMATQVIKNLLKHNSGIANSSKNAESLNALQIKSKIGNALKMAAISLPICYDLSYCLIVNYSDEAIITSDNPAVLYNQYLEDRKPFGSNCGLATKGLQIIFPLSPHHILMFYDKDVYGFGRKHPKIIKTAISRDIFQLNGLQVINSVSNLYFKSSLSQKNLLGLVDAYKPKRRVSLSTLKEYPETNPSPGKIKITLHGYANDIKINMRLSFIKYLKKALSYQLGHKAIHVRDEFLVEAHSEFVKLAKSGRYRYSEFNRFMQDKKAQFSPGSA